MFAEVALSNEMAFALVIGVVSTLAGVVTLLYREWKSTMEKAWERDRRELEVANIALEAEKKARDEIAKEAIRASIDIANHYRKKEGLGPVPVLAGVVSEGNSPSTQVQRDQAELATMRANLAAVKLATGLPAREEPEHAIETRLPHTAVGAIQLFDAADRIERTADQIEGTAAKIDEAADKLREDKGGK